VAVHSIGSRVERVMAEGYRSEDPSTMFPKIRSYTFLLTSPKGHANFLALWQDFSSKNNGEAED